MNSRNIGMNIMRFISNDIKLFSYKKNKIRQFILELTSDYNSESIGQGQIAGIRVYLIYVPDGQKPEIFIKSALIYNRYESNQYISKLRHSNIFIPSKMQFLEIDVIYNERESSDEEILKKFESRSKG